MRLELQWAFVKEDIPDQPCDLCEVEFKGRAVIIRTDPYGYEACEECLRALSQRKEQEPGAPWPTWEEYQALVESHPEPMFASDEELEATQPLAEGWPAYTESWLWSAPAAR